MKIDRIKASAAKSVAAGEEISKVFDLKVQGRVCGALCNKKCPECGASDCQCSCSPDCPDLPRTLSPEPDLYPIEDAIAPLVFEMKRTGIFVPCWSCEGHLSPNSPSLWKIPQVWFYCDSVVHLRLLAEMLSQLKIDNVTKAQWEVAVGFSDVDNPDTTFALRPQMKPDHGYSLWQLQADAAAMARELEPALSRKAAKLKSLTAGAP